MRAMKDSGIEWIGQIPQGWETRQLKYALASHSGGAWGVNRGESEQDCICVRVADFDYSHLNVNFSDVMTIRSYPKKVIAESALEKGDILLEKSGGGETTPVGRSVLFSSEKEMMCANFIEWLRSNASVQSHFLNYWLSAAYINGYSKRNVKQTTGIQNLDIPAFLSETILIPPVEEQRRISKYLDANCAKLDALIAAKEKTNALLKERRQSIIYEAVTKGLDPTVPMKDSGIEWIGEIPQGWRVERLRFHASLNPSTELPDYSDEAMVSFVPMDHLKSGFHLQSSVPYEKVKKGYVCFAEEDILMAKVTPCLENGNLAIASRLVDGVGFGSTEINVIRCKTIQNKFLFFLLQCPAYIEKATYNMYGVAGLKRLDPNFLPNSFFPIPSSDEQAQIASHLDCECEKIDTIVLGNASTIQKLKEYRQSLIYEAVTGKIEVK